MLNVGSSRLQSLFSCCSHALLPFDRDGVLKQKHYELWVNWRMQKQPADLVGQLALLALTLCRYAVGHARAPREVPCRAVDAAGRNAGARWCQDGAALTFFTSVASGASDIKAPELDEVSPSRLIAVRLSCVDCPPAAVFVLALR